MSAPVIVVGAGIAGLRCAQILQQAGVDYLLLEKSDGVGGRMRTDLVDDFRLDRGFQVFQTAYPEAQTALDYQRLELSPLEPGALIFTGGKWVRMVDPWRRPQHALSTLLNPIGTPLDRWRLLRLRAACSQAESSGEMSDAANDISTRALLTDECGFSDDFVNRFMQPWLSGIFLETQLSTSASFFRFVFRMLSTGDISYPAAGIQAIPDQLFDRVDQSRVQFNVPIQSVAGDRVTTTDDRHIAASAVIVATDLAAARSLIDGWPPSDARDFTATRCTYYAADAAPMHEATLLLNGTERGPVNHIFVMTNASPRLAPAGRALISVSSVGQHALHAFDRHEQEVQLKEWFGPQAEHWQELATYDLPMALPAQPAGFAGNRPQFASPGLFLCGDHCETASVQGALKSGRIAAEAVISKLAHG